MNIAVDFATAVLDILVLSIFLRGLYQNNVRSTFFVWTAYIIAGMLLCVLSLFSFHPMLRLGIAFIIFFALSIVLYGAKWMNAFYGSLLLCVINVIVDYSISTLMTFFGIPTETLAVYGNNRVLYIVISKLVLFFLVFLVIRISKWRRLQDSFIESVPLLLCQVFSVFICYLMYLAVYNAATKITWGFVVGAIGILYINIIIFLYVERIKEVGEIRRQNELADLQYQLKVDYFDQIKEEQAETRALWHDIKKYLNTMNELMNMNDIRSARDCIAQVTDLFDGIGRVVNVGNTVVSAVLNASVQKARRMNIETELDIRVRPDLDISAADLSVIVGNTVDNAIEACEPLADEDKKISMQLIQKGAILYYEIKNPYMKTDPELETEEKNPKLHGYGLKNVKRCIDKYKGTMTIYSCDKYFVVSIHMNLPIGSNSGQMVS